MTQPSSFKTVDTTRDIFPFETRLSLAPMLQETAKAQGLSAEHRALQGVFADALVNHPAIGEEGDWNELWQNHQNLLKGILDTIFPPLLRESQLGYLSAPFKMRPVYATAALATLIDMEGSQFRFEALDNSDQIPLAVKACFMILREHYKINLDYELNFFFRYRSDLSRAPRYYKGTFLQNFTEVKVNGELPVLDDELLHRLLQDVSDVDNWLDFFSPELFVFEGLFLAFLNDISEVEIRSRLRNLLLAPKSLLQYETAKEIADFTRAYLQIEDIEVGLMAIDYPVRESVAAHHRIHYPALNEMTWETEKKFRQSIYGHSCALNQDLTVSDLTKLPSLSAIERSLVAAGFRSLLIFLLRDQDQGIIGLLELAVKRPNAFNHLTRLRMHEILPLFHVAIEESRNYIEAQIRNVIQEHYTNIHPAVLWKFNRAAYQYLEAQEQGTERPDIPDIELSDVFPLFGQIDVVNSSEIRNRAIKTDLVNNLTMMLHMVDPLWDEMSNRPWGTWRAKAAEFLRLLDDGLTSDLEMSVADFLRVEVFGQLREMLAVEPDRAATMQTLHQYIAGVEATIGLITTERRKYEESLKRLNGTIQKHLEREEAINQRLVPHFFDSFRSDGIEYNLFVGQSILRHARFSMHHLESLRRWQLRSMVQLYRLSTDLKPSLSVAIDVTFLILAFGGPLTVRFRREEKRFDVDNSYGTPYELLKKRIDKATIKGTDERVRQIGKLVVVVMHERERTAYIGYMEALRAEGALKGDLEIAEVEIEALQGVQALMMPFQS